MKNKIMIVLTVILCLVLMATPVMAAGGSAAVSSASGAPGSTVYLTVSISEFEDADTLGFAVEGLSVDAAKSSWLVSGGSLHEIKSTAGVWTTTNAASNLNGNIVKLAITVPELEAGAASASHNVKVTVVVKRDNENLGSVVAIGVVTAVCPHSNLTETAAKPATCTATGNNQYYTCNSCGTVLASDKSTVTTADAQTLAKLNHTGGTATCTDKAICDSCKQPYGNTLEHSYSWVVDTPATETATGLKHEECSCGHKRNENTVIPKLDHVHVGITHHAAVAATCTAKGNVEYWTCSSTLCAGKYYGDAACQQEISAIETQIDAANHTGGTEIKNSVTATCCAEGYTGDTYCKGCSNMIQKGQNVNATGNHAAGATWTSDESNHWQTCTTEGCGAAVNKASHAFVWKTDKEATELATGLKHEECSCGYKRNENTVIPKLDHVHVGITHHAAVAATCTAKGNVEYWTCSGVLCAGKYYGDAACQQEITTIVTDINPENHTGGTEAKDAKEPNCYTEGYTGDVYCKGCSNMILKGETIAATGKHTTNNEWKVEGDQHWQICTTEGCGAEVNKSAHTFVWKTDKEATETATGLKHEECSCGTKRSEDTVIEKLKHSPYRVKAKEATCTEEGSLEHYYCAGCKRYFASENGKIGKQIQKADVIIPATGHIFGEPWVYDSQYHWSFCQCGEESEKEMHTAELIGQIEASETEEGYTGDEICTVCQIVLKTGEVVPCVTVPSTEAPTEAPTVTPTEVPAVQEEPQYTEEKSGNSWLLIVAIVAAVGAAGLAFTLPIIKKRK